MIIDVIREETWYSEEKCPRHEIISCIGRLYNNRFSVSSYQNSDIAVGMYPLAYLMNHRCMPNSTFVFNGDCIVVRSIADIRKGEEITVGFNLLLI